jgi:4'-phosphopantetheinyl transferase
VIIDVVTEVWRSYLKKAEHQVQSSLSQIDCAEPKLSPNPPLDERGVLVWFVDLCAPNSLTEGLDKVLSSAERERAAKFKFEKDRACYVASHAALRNILGWYLRIEPLALEFSAGPQGKPELESKSDRHALQFNLSHSHEAALVAVTLGRQIGVDIECIKGDFQWEEIAERFFAPGEIARLRALPRDQQQRAFFTCWTRKEAYIKAKGGGLSIPLQDFEVSVSPGEPASLMSCITDPEEVARWSLAEVDAGPDYEAAVAVQGRGWDLKCLRWTPEV